ncbi:MAG: DNA polymerase III subunit gamma/tau, partial [Gammaproteobacteria bacterium]|nr:DNA polymerase III subunit gamma/tau [Gammaproteobacteria bacterium]
CSACAEIDAGRFVDLLEVDAASRTKVDQTRELLENVPYAPVRGRYKVYLIDEVHMFSESSFNALLKTLEEPPPHVKFLLATTDPQKVPVTVLSRCLQFNLKRLPAELIRDQLRHILDAERVPGEDGALTLVARAADGSMRDGLSLLDQAIAFGGGQVTEADVRAMLGTVDRERVYDLLDALQAGDGKALLGAIDVLAERAPDFAGVLAELLAVLHRVAVAQLVEVPEELDDTGSERAGRLVQGIPPEDVQLYYQIGLMGQRDLPLAPDPRSGFEMVLLRMLAFRPAEATAGAPSPARARDRQGVDSARGGTPADGVGAAPPPRYVRPGGDPPAGARPPARVHDRSKASPARGGPPADGVAGDSARGVPPAGGAGAAPSPRGGRPDGEPPVAGPPPARIDDFADWHGAVERLGLGGMALQLARQCTVGAWDAAASRLVLRLDPGHAQLMGSLAEGRLREALGRLVGRPVALAIRVEESADETPAQRARRHEAERREAAVGAMREDPLAQALAKRFEGRLLEDTVVPVDDPGGTGQ